MKRCACQSDYRVVLLRPDDYRRFKMFLSAGGHPAFIGSDLFRRHALNGGALAYQHDGIDAAMSLMHPRKGALMALNVAKAHRGHGLGQAVTRHLMPNFIRATADKAGFFEALGYRKVGEPKRGYSLETQLLARESLFSLAGNFAAFAKSKLNNPGMPLTATSGAGTGSESTHA